MLLMKGVTFAVAFILTIILVVFGTILYPETLGQAVTSNNQFVFGFFLGAFFTMLFLAWIGEKIILKLWKK